MKRRQDDPTDPPEDYNAKIDSTAELDLEIAKRAAALARNISERAAGMRAGEATSTGEPHRDWHVYALGADLVQCGLTGRDAFALMGWRSLPLGDAIEMLLDADEAAPGVYLGRLLAIIVDRHRATLEPRGQFVSWRRRWARYRAELASWAAQPDSVKTGPWREQPMTSGQRELIRETATRLDLLMPEGLDRGAAADWLDRHGANLTFRKEI